MFTGIIECRGSIASLGRRGGGLRAGIKVPPSFDLGGRVALGDSIAVNGVCLTASALHGDVFEADVSQETVECSCFGRYRVGTAVNLELATTPQTRLGGHIVQGHVDGVGTVLQREALGEAYNLLVRVPRDLLRYIAPKGSVAIDGVSLTVNAIEGDVMRITLIPHTQDRVNFSDWQPGVGVNLEADVLARYLERLVEGRRGGGGLTLATLQGNGF
ncbi:MAG: riboflavin synthase [Succinivibrionaceae bacterium]|nr:riboflavin synthase [Succinivibrionaceae bacterium]